MNREWDQAIERFVEYLPSTIAHWIVALELPAHARISRSLIPWLGSAEVFILGVSPPTAIDAVGQKYVECDDVGFIEFAVNDGLLDHEGIDYRSALMRFAGWPCSRMKLCFDVWDDNFPVLFAERPQSIKERCRRIRKALEGTRELSYSIPTRNSPRLVLDFAGSKWVEYSGLEKYDYILPSGEVACLPKSVDGLVEVDGWIIGTIPFGLKYGRIHRGDLLINFRGGTVCDLAGDDTRLCKDFEMALEKLPGLQAVAEVGVGQSKAVAKAVHLYQAAYQWHERHLGLHLGLGAQLPETFDADQRSTGHHLDIVLSAGSLTGETGVLLRW